MKNFLIFVIINLAISINHSKAENDTIGIIAFEEDNYTYNTADNLDSLLSCWFYHIGRDSITYLEPHERYLFDTNISDSLFEARIKNISCPIDLSYNKVVQKYLDMYIKNGKWVAPKFLGLSNQYFPIFEEKLDAYNMPLELKYLPVVESALNPQAKSRSGATGLWQFMYKTGKGYGLEINSYVDERMDPVRSTEVACEYLNSLHKTYNDWILALAAYNCGPSTVNNAIRRAGGKTNYWDIYPYLPHETKNYVPKYIAITYMFSYPEEHGFKPEFIPFYNDVDTIMIRKELHFAQLDSVIGVSVAQTRELNPQYKKDIVPAKTKQYPLRMRREYISKFIEFEDSIYSFKDSIFFNPKKYNYKPNENYADYTPIAAQPKGTIELNYTVKSGDVIGLIASWYDVRITDLKAWNGLSSNNIKIGNSLKVYVPKDKVEKFKNINDMSFEERQNSVGIDPDTNKHKKETLNPEYEYYTVKQGDTPYNIASRFDGISVDDIIELNGISDPSKLKIGQNLKIRKKQ
jgi:membrane-bound lytic murein transglycosylase D